MAKKTPWTQEQLEKFDDLTDAATTPSLGFTRNIARLKLMEFEREVGTELCQAMFDHLQKKDAQK